MPVDKIKFKEAQRPLEERIYEFFKERSDKAFTLAEIVAEIEEVDINILILSFVVEDKNPDSMYHRYVTAIKNLVNKDLVEMSLLKGNLYFAVKEQGA